MFACHFGDFLAIANQLKRHHRGEAMVAPNAFRTTAGADVPHDAGSGGRRVRGRPRGETNTAVDTGDRMGGECL